MEPDNPKVKISVVDENGAVRTPVFVHGVLEDYRAWDSQMDPFSKHFRAIAYSRRYNFPNQNRVIAADHSAMVEADDLAALLKTLHLPRAHLIGSSYGALTVLILGIKHPELARTLTLSEPPVQRWVADLPEGKETFDEFMGFWNAVGDAFRRGDSTKALRVSTNFFSEGHATYDSLPRPARGTTDVQWEQWEQPWLS